MNLNLIKVSVFGTTLWAIGYAALFSRQSDLKTLPAAVRKPETPSEANAAKMMIFLAISALALLLILLPFCCIFCASKDDEKKGTKRPEKSKKSPIVDEPGETSDCKIDCGANEFNGSYCAQTNEMFNQ